MSSSDLLILAAITFGASIVNGGLGYGFSSLTVPLALFVVSSRVLNPALVLVELVLNAYVLWVNRDALPRVWRRMLPIMIGMVPGIIAGTMALSIVSTSWLKLITFLVLLPIILLQTAGFRRPIQAERTAGLAFGAGAGGLYAMTTISGPPLAMFLSNQGFTQRDFRAALGLVRVLEATVATITYAVAGLFTSASNSVLPAILPSVIIGVPIGARLIKRIRAETFRRACMSFDAAVVAFGVAALLRELHIVEGWASYALLGAVLLFNAVVLYRHFKGASSTPAPSSSSATPVYT